MTIEEWIKQVTDILINTWGLDKNFAQHVSPMLYYFIVYGLSPSITSGYRSAAKQAELYDRWVNEDPSIVVKPATKSKHCVTKWGRPASLAIDIVTNNYQIAKKIANAVGVLSGMDFNTPDPVHFYI